MRITPTVPHSPGTAAASRWADASGASFTEYSLPNGLRVVLYPDPSTPMVTINVLYHVGSKNEERGRTGFAHLFEHLMFDGSRHVERGGYDRFCTSVGGDNNAFTSSDITDYYISLPSDRLALGLWLESDRMAGFAIQEISLVTQKNVVIEEKRQSTDDVPYGDATIVMRELAYDPSHPYSWEPIGSVEDINAAGMDDVRAFYQRFYVPSNATLVIAGDFDPDEARELVDAYFGPIPSGDPIVRPAVDVSLERYGMRRRIDSPIIPFNAVFLGYHAPGIHHRDIYPLELLTAIMAEGESSRLYQTLEYSQEIASEAECFIDDGEIGSTFYVYAVGQQGSVTTDELERALREEIRRVATEGVSERELEKVKNKKVTRVVHSLQSISNRAERLAYFSTLMNDPMLAFREADLYAGVTTDDIRRVAARYLLNVEPNVVEYHQVARRKRRGAGQAGS